MSADPAPRDRRALVRECLLASVGILVALGALKHLIGIVPYVATIAVGLQLYIPIFIIGRAGITREGLGLGTPRWKRDLLIVAGLGVITIVPFAIGHHVWQTEVFGRSYHARLPAGMPAAVLDHLLVAIAEELYFRGYLQRRLEMLWPAKRRLFGTPFGLAIVVAAAVFALAHFVGEYRPDRLGPFFPALLFGLLRTRTGSILAPVGYHAFCNILADVLWASYAPG